MAIRPWSEDIWFSPKYIIETLENEVANGIPILDRKLKKHREARICAVSIICFSKNYPKEFWIQIPKQDPPDALVADFVIRQDGKGQDMHVTPFEVFEINSFTTESVEDEIKRKLQNKDYSNTVIIGYLRRVGTFDLDAIAKKVQAMSPNVDSIYLIAFEQTNYESSLMCLFPTSDKSKESYKLFCQQTSQRDFTELKRSTSTERTDNTTTDTLTVFPD